MVPSIIRTPDDAFATLTDWPFEPNNATFDGIRMHYVDEGPHDAPAFLLTHGEPTWSYMYRRWIPRLAEAGYRVIAADHIGFGRSDKVTDPSWYVIERHVAMQRALIESLDLNAVHLFCQDWGGPISLRNVCDMPQRFARLFIGNTWLHHEGFVYSDGMRNWREMALDPEQLRESMPTGLIVQATLRREGHDADAVRAAYDAPFPTRESKTGARRFPFCIPFAEPEAGGAAWQQRCYNELQSVGIPIHFVWGDADAIFPWSQAEDWHAAVNGSTLDAIRGAGHFVQEDAPDDCVDVIMRYV